MKGYLMADTSKRPVEQATAGPGEQRAAVRPQLAKASESGLPDVQKLLAERWTAQQNGDSDGAARVSAQLAELGFE
jgi:hypothetical protein